MVSYVVYCFYVFDVIFCHMSSNLHVTFLIHHIQLMYSRNMSVTELM